MWRRIGGEGVGAVARKLMNAVYEYDPLLPYTFSVFEIAYLHTTFINTAYYLLHTKSVSRNR